MNILIIEPFFTGSHAMWAQGYADHSAHDVDILELSGNHWKWRMHGGAVTLARRYLQRDRYPDLIIATDMLDLTTFLALTRPRSSGVPTAVYFHENQLTYPWSPRDRDLKHDRDKHYSFINVASALAADRVFFNSRFHRESFVAELPGFLKQFPDHQELGQVEAITAKSHVLPLGLDLEAFDSVEPSNDPWRRGDKRTPLIVWNHRWEYDKNPEEFFAALEAIAARGRDFDVALLGEVFDVTPDAFVQGTQGLTDRIVTSGYVESRAEYAKWLWQADIVPVTSYHDFFGASVVEALYCGCFPLLPRRLAYPELIPDKLHAGCFYDNFDDLVRKLDAAVMNVQDLQTAPFRDAVSRFDWQVMAASYDNAFQDLTSAK
jgi:glycosyltransferase involved in cell wall biosynthesis